MTSTRCHLSSHDREYKQSRCNMVWGIDKPITSSVVPPLLRIGPCMVASCLPEVFCSSSKDMLTLSLTIMQRYLKHRGRCPPFGVKESDRRTRQLYPNQKSTIRLAQLPSSSSSFPQSHPGNSPCSNFPRASRLVILSYLGLSRIREWCQQTAPMENAGRSIWLSKMSPL